MTVYLAGGVHMNPLINWILVVAGAVLILLEVILGAISGFDFLLIGSAILVGGVLGLVTDSGLTGLAVGGVLSILYILVGRSRVRARMRRPGLPSNTDAVLGRTARVIEALGPDRPGRVNLDGEEWRALADLDPEAASRESIPAGALVRISRIDGVTVFVVPAAEARPAGGNRS